MVAVKIVLIVLTTVCLQSTSGFTGLLGRKARRADDTQKMHICSVDFPGCGDPAYECIFTQTPYHTWKQGYCVPKDRRYCKSNEDCEEGEYCKTVLYHITGKFCMSIYD
ncbi:uncharacterized protein LOC142349601 [Convolutriloba macropyga]|uniref:uncharacterized protein LOC142349601 n=1 Tax=Convolutriloba macropyga TaxID=536237 RepID=UPI003F525D24